jgi:hypothetical protein
VNSFDPKGRVSTKPGQLQLSDLPDDVLQDIGLRGKEINRLRNGKSPMMLHMG